MTAAEFLIRYPEFASAQDAFPGLIDAKLADADAATSDSYGTRRNDALSLLAAHLLALSPFGVNAQMQRKGFGGEILTTYGTRLEELRVINACARDRIR